MAMPKTRLSPQLIVIAKRARIWYKRVACMTKELGGYSGREESPQQTSKKAEDRPYAPRSSKVFYERARAAGAFENIDDRSPILDERRERLLEAYLTTPATAKDLRPLAGGVSIGRVMELLHDAYDKFLDNLPQEVADDFSRVEHFTLEEDFARLEAVGLGSLRKELYTEEELKRKRTRRVFPALTALVKPKNPDNR